LALKSSSAKTVLEGRIGTLRMQEWQLNSVVEVFIDASVERLWAALTEAADTEQYFMRSRVTVGDVGEAYRLERDDGWEVDGTVLAKEPPYRLRVAWRIKTPPDLVMPNCEVEYLIEPTLASEARSTKAFYKLMNFDVGSSAFLVDYVNWFHVRIKLLPLPGPVGPNLFFPHGTPSFRCLGPTNVLTHERLGAVDIPMIEGRVGLSYQCLGVRHESSGVHTCTVLPQFRGCPEPPLWG